MIASGVLAALGGAYLSIGFVALVQPEHDRGPRLHRAGGGDLRQVEARAARSRRALLFGFSSALAAAAAGVLASRSATLFQALPYVLTLIAVAGLVGRSRPPAADGIPYVKE